MPKAQHARQYLKVQRLLRELRNEAGLTQRSLGQLLKKPQSCIYNCESGNRRVDLSEFVQWCQACNIKPVAALQRYLSA